jgi:NADPH:quinone reductase
MLFDRLVVSAWKPRPKARSHAARERSTSALGQAVINIATDLGAVVIATTRDASRLAGLRAIKAEHSLLEEPNLSARVRGLYPDGIDAAVDLVGTSTILDSIKMMRRNGRVCLGGFLGGLEPVNSLNPLIHVPSGVQLSVFGSFVLGADEFSDIPLQLILDEVAAGAYKAKPAKVFQFAEMPQAHRFLESSEANGKVVVRFT